MHLQRLRSALDELETDPEQPQAWQALEETLSNGQGLDDADEKLRLLYGARQEHYKRREWEAVARLLGNEVRLTLGSDREVERLREGARVLRENLLEEGAACKLFERILELRPEDQEAALALEESRGKRDTWQQLVDTYLAEAETAPDDLYRSSMAMRAAEVEIRYGAEQTDRERVIERLTQALELDPRNERAAEILELMYRQTGDYEQVVQVLGRLTESAESISSRVAAALRAARVQRHRLNDEEAACELYRSVLELTPSNQEALAFVSGYYAEQERWEELISVYESSLQSGELASRERLGELVQVAMLIWKKRGDVEGAFPWFERLRKLDPASQGMLDFYREYYAGEENASKLLEVLSGAQRLLPSGDDKQRVTAEIARLAAGQQEPERAIEQYKNLLRQDPSNAQAQLALKELYRITGAFHALVDLLRQQLEPTTEDADRLPILREVAELYRDELANDTALVSVLNQIIQIEPDDISVVRELVALYEKLGRWRDLLTSQQRLATMTEDRDEKLELMRAAGRRWLDQFSNAQNAMQAFEAIVEIAPDDREARDRLRELYKKRRAWPALFTLYERELPSAQGEERVELLAEMARLAAERLGKGDQAVAIYKQILDAQPDNEQALSSLERYAERNKDFATLADALERRVELTAETPQRMAVLQKLGGVYADQLSDTEAATRTYLRVLDLSPGHARALRVLREGYLASGDYDGLEALYASQSDWEGLADVLSTSADRSKEDEAKVALSYRAAAVYEDKLQQPERAFRCYERILSVRGDDLRAARALIPIYEKEEKWARLPALYELCLAAADDVEEKSELLQKLIRLTGTRLVDRARALSYARTAFELTPADPMAMTQLEDASRAARDWEPFVQAVVGQLQASGAEVEVASADSAAPPAVESSGGGKKRRRRRRRKKDSQPAASVPAPPASLSESTGTTATEGALPAAVVRQLRMKLAVVYDEHLGRTAEAIDLLQTVVQDDPADTEAITVLEQWLRREGRREELRQLWDLKLSQQQDREQRISLLSDWANVEQTEFESSERAADLYRRILEVEPGRLSALRALPRLLMSLGKAEDAAQAIEEQREHVSGADRADMDFQLSELYLGELSDPQRALDAALSTLKHSPEDRRVPDLLRRLVEVPQTRLAAAQALADNYGQSGDARREAEALESALEALSEPDQRREMFARLTLVYEQKLDSKGSAFDVVLRALREFCSETGLWEKAEELGLACGRIAELSHVFRDVLRSELPPEVERELCDRAARLHEVTLGDPLAAAPYLERLLQADSADQDAFLRLKQILTSAERWGELEDLYNRATQAIEDVPTRIDLLTEVALVCEEIIEDDPKAIAYYERTLELDPHHDGSMRALDRLYQRTNAHKQLASLLERRLEGLAGDEALDVALRLATVQLRELHEPAKAIGHVEHVLQERLDDYQGRELAEEILEIASLKVRAARALEPVYEAKEEVRLLVKVLEVRWEAHAEDNDGDAHERRELLRRIAHLKDERLHDDAGALEAFGRLVPEDPLDDDARSRFVEIGLRKGEYARVASVLEQTAAASDLVGFRGNVLMQAAQIHAENLADLDRAESIYRRVLELDPSDMELTLQAARALEGLYDAKDNYAQLAEMIRVQVRLEVDGESRAALLGRLGELSEKRLRDPYAAIEAYRQQLDDQPDQPATLEALERLYEATEQWRELVAVLEQLCQLSQAPEERQKLLRKQAGVFSEQLSDVSEATEVWRLYRSEFGDSEEVLSSLERLYRDAKRWDDLADTYEAHLALEMAEEQRLRLLTDLGDLRGEQLSLPQAALDAYRQALALDAAFAPARHALERLLESQDAMTQREAAEILEPVFAADADHQKLLRVLEIQAAAVEDPIAKLELLGKCADLSEEALGNPERTLTYVTQAVREAVGHADLAGWLERLDRIAKLTKRRSDQVALLREIVLDIFEGELQFDVTRRIAELARDELGDRELSREYFERALELRMDAPGPLEALERIYEESGDTQSLLGVLERRAESSSDDAVRRELMLRRAYLLRDRLNDRDAAIEVLERVVDFDLTSEAVSALEELYGKTDRWEQVLELNQRLEEAPSSDVTSLRVRSAEVCAEHLRDLPRAFEFLEAALDVDPGHAGAVDALARLMQSAPEAEYRARAAALLEPIYQANRDFDRVMQTLSSRLEFSQDPVERRELLTRLAKLHEEQKEDYAAALSTLARLLVEDVTDTSTTEELERIARVADNPAELASIYARALESVEVDEPATAKLSQRAAQLYAGIGELEKSQHYYRRALRFDPEDREVFEELDELLARSEAHQDRVELYRAARETRYDDAERVQLLHQTAQLQRGPLQQPREAVESYRAALEIDPLDTVSLDALSELYRELSDWTALAELCLQRADSIEDLTEAAFHRLTLARLRANELNDVPGAIDQLEEILQALPTHGEALDELEVLRKRGDEKERIVQVLLPLYEASDDWRRLIKLNEDRFDIAGDLGERVAVLRETAELWEVRGKDLDRARRGLAVAFELDPEDPEIRRNYERLTEATGAWDELAGVYQERLRQSELLCRVDVLSVLARVHDEERNDPRRALMAYEALVEADEGNLEAIEKLEQLATMLSDWEVLVHALRGKVEHVDDDEERARLWRHIGETRRDMLDQPQLAIEAYERAAELEPHSSFTLDNLIDLYEDRPDSERLIDLYQRRVDLADEDEAELRFELLCKAAALYEEKLTDKHSALDLYNQALGLNPSDAAVLKRVNALYSSEEMWPELLENLRFLVTIADSDDERLRLKRRIGSVLAEHLGEYGEALETYRQVLESTPGDEGVIASVQKIGAEQPEERELASDILVPALTSLGRNEDLIAALEMRLSVVADPLERAEVLRQIAGVHEVQLQNSAAAQEALLRALVDQPESEELHSEIHRLSEACDGFRAYAEALRERAQSTFDADLATALYSRLGRINEQELGDQRAAIEAYEEAVRQAGDQPELLEALDRLYTSVEDYDTLAEVLERRALAADSDVQRAEFQYRTAIVQRDRFDDPAAALESLRSTLDSMPGHEGAAEALEQLLERPDYFEEAFEALETAYRSVGKKSQLSALFERRIALATEPGEKLQARRTLARVLEDEIADAAGAQRILQQGLIEQPSELSLLDELERLACLTGDFRSAVEAVTTALETAVSSEPETGREMALVLARWQREHLSDEGGAEAAIQIALQCAPDSEDLLAQLEELQQGPGRELALIETLRKRGRLALGDDREAHFRRAYELAKGQQTEGLVEDVLRDFLRLESDNDWALEQLAKVREASGAAEEALELMERRIEGGQSENPPALKHRAAEIARDQVRDLGRAASLYSSILDDDPTDLPAFEALRDLLAEGERYPELKQLLVRGIETAADSERRVALRMDLVELELTQFDARDEAIELLREVLDDAPSHTEAVLSLSRLLEVSDRTEELASLLHQQVDAAAGRDDVDATLQLLMKLAIVCETKLESPERAVEAYLRALEFDPHHAVSLEALVKLYTQMDRKEDATDVLGRLLDQAAPSEIPQLAMQLSSLYTELNQLPEAAAALERAVEVGQSKEVSTRLRALYEQMGNWSRLAEALANDAEAAQSVEEKVDLLRAAADVYLTRLEDAETAATLLQTATDLTPEDRPLLLQLCEVLNVAGRGKEAVETLQRIVQSYGGRRSRELGEIHRRLAKAYIAQGQKDDALRELDHAFRIEPGNVTVLVELGALALQQGELKKAQQMYRALLLQRLDDESPITKAQVFYHLGRVHDALGERPKAKQMLERALQTDSGLDEARALLEGFKAS